MGKKTTGKNAYMFVYGTLKQGYGNNARCMEGATFVGPAVSEAAIYSMHAPSVVPYLFKAQASPNDWVGGVNGAKVAGEIFECPPDVVARCDILEGHPHAYCREEQKFYITDRPSSPGGGLGPRLVSAWVYLMRAERMRGASTLEPVDGVVTYDPEGKYKMSAREAAADSDDFEDGDETDQDDSDIAGDEVTVVLEDGDYGRYIKLGQRRNGDLTVNIANYDEDATESLSQGQFEEMVKKARALMSWEAPQD